MGNSLLSLKRVWLLAMAIFVISFSVSCKSGSGATTLPSLPDPDEPTDPDEPEDPTPIADDEFKVYVGSGLASGLSHHIHHEDDYDKECSVKADESLADRNATCFLEVAERDLSFHGFQVTFGASSDFCAYVRHTPYYYADRNFGDGPDTVETEITAGVKTGVTNATASGEPDCPFDYSDEDGPNCCLGQYTYNEVNNDDVTQSINETREWGGSVTSCLSGPAVDTQPLDDEGYPKPTIHFLGIGEGNKVTFDYTAKFPGDIFPDTIYYANFFDPADHPTSGLPAGFDKDADGVLDPQREQSLYYQFECMDQANEVKANINLVVREWNTLKDMGPTGDPDIEGVDPDSPTGDDFNDLRDWKDFGDTFPQLND